MRRYLALLPIYLLAAVLPLALHIAANFEYEYALLSAYCALLLIPLAGVLVPRSILPFEDGKYSPPYAFEFLWILLISPIFGLIPGAFMFATKACKCSAPGYGFWMLIVWYPSWVLAHAFLNGILRLRCRGWGRIAVTSALLCVYLALVIHAAALIWLAPQKHLLHLFTGFWHGPIYDSFIAVDTGIVLTRVSHLLAALLLLSVIWLRKSVFSILVVAGFTALWLYTAQTAGDYASTQNSKAKLDSLLAGEISRPGFKLHYQKVASSTGDAVPIQMQRLARDAEFHIAELTQILADGEGSLPTVDIYVYPDRDSKKLWFGGGATDVADVRTPSIHITGDSWPHPTLRHELVHALASRFGYHGMGFHPNMAFTEGLAVALAPTPLTMSFDDGAADLLASGKLPTVETLFSPMFWTVSGGRAYTVAGSFLSFLLETHGISGIKALYSGQDFQAAFGVGEAELIAAWKRKISEKFDRLAYELYSEALFRDPGVLHEQCPHSKADLVRNREESLYTRMRQPLGWDPDTAYLPWLLSLDPKDREPQVKLWRAEAYRLTTDRVPKLAKIKDLRDRLAQARHQPATNLEDVEIGILESDLAAILGDRQGSVALLKALTAESKTRFFGDVLQREIAARMAIESGAGGMATLEWRRYLAGWRKAIPMTSTTTALNAASSSAPTTPTSVAQTVVKEREPWILTYLKLRNPKAAPSSARDLRQMLTGVTPDPELPLTFTREWYRLLGERLMQVNAYADAGVAYDRAAQAAVPAARPAFAEHARRARFGVSHSR